MIRFETVRKEPDIEFLRDVGLPLNKFLDVLESVTNYIENEKEENSLKRRGIKSINLNIADKLLTLRSKY